MHTSVRPRLGAAAALALALLSGSGSVAADPVTLRFVTKQFPPYAYTGPDGRPAGPMVALLQAACAQVDWSCPVRVLPWRRAYQVIEAGEADGIFPFVNTPDRQAQYALSPDIVRGRYVLVAKAPRHGSAEALLQSPGTIAAFGPSEASRTLMGVVSHLPGARPQVEADPDAVLRKLLAGRYGDHGLGLVNEAVARWQLTAPQAGELQTLRVVREFNYGYALLRRPDHEALARQLADAFNRLCQAGDTARILQPYALTAADCLPRSAAPAPQPTPLPGARHGGLIDAPLQRLRRPS